jgi:hypothetical protein
MKVDVVVDSRCIESGMEADKAMRSLLLKWAKNWGKLLV